MLIRPHKETVLSIIIFWRSIYPTISFNKSLDYFADSVESYKNAERKNKLDCLAWVFIYSCIVLSVDALTGAQAMEVFNNCATDLGIDKLRVQKKINSLMYKARKDYEKHNTID